MPKRSTGWGRIVIGFDLSSRKIAAVATTPAGDFVTLSRQLVKTSERGGTAQACASAYAAAGEFVASLANDFTEAPIFVWIEAPIVGRGGIKSTLSQTFISGAVQASIAALCREVNIVFPSQWKKAVVGRGNATKVEVTRYLRSTWPNLAGKTRNDQDLTDAACICLYGEQETGLSIV